MLTLLTALGVGIPEPEGGGLSRAERRPELPWGAWLPVEYPMMVY
jgi:hypothetical protein